MWNSCKSSKNTREAINKKWMSKNFKFLYRIWASFLQPANDMILTTSLCFFLCRKSCWTCDFPPNKTTVNALRCRIRFSTALTMLNVPIHVALYTNQVNLGQWSSRGFTFFPKKAWHALKARAKHPLSSIQLLRSMLLRDGQQNMVTV